MGSGVVPRGDGRDSGSPRPNRARGAAPQYIPKKLRNRLVGSQREGFDEKKPEWPSGIRFIDYRTLGGEYQRHHRPGSQNPRK